MTIKEFVKTSLSYFWEKLKTLPVNNLTSTSTSYPLAASQGKVLNDKINNISGYGTNSNGSYWKFADGTLICCKRITDTVDITTAWGTMYEYVSAYDLGNWPHSFSGTPFIFYSASGNSENSEYAVIIEKVEKTSATWAGGAWLSRPLSSPSCKFIIQIMGIGRWN